MLSYNNYNIYEAICEGIGAHVEYNRSMTEVAAIVQNCLERNDKVPIKIYCESPDYSVPEYAHEDEDACVDLRVRWIEQKVDRIICHTGVHLEIPKGYMGMVFPRSSITKTGWYIPNFPGIIDSGYRGEILVVFRHTTSINRDEFPFKEGDRCAQFCVVQLPNICFNRVSFLEDLEPSNRGDGGYGSTGTK